MSFQRSRDAERPVRSLDALRFLPELSGLVLNNNEITNLSALRGCRKLRRLSLDKNPIRDLSPLADCQSLKQLEAGSVPIDDFSPLEHLPKLRELSITSSEIPAFRKLKTQTSLRKLELGGVDSFEGLPFLPELRVIRGGHVRSLSGLERFPELQNLINLNGEFDSLEPLRDLKHLTHANIIGSRVGSLEPLSRSLALREFWFRTDAREVDLRPLEGLPSLHAVDIKCAGKEPRSLAKLRSGLSSWDVEFQSEQPRHTPSLELEVVSQKAFDYYDAAHPYGVTEADTNEGLLESELQWVQNEVEEVFAVDFAEEEDYLIPYRWNGARSFTVVLYSERAIEAFPRLVLGMQRALHRCHKDWIIYFQSDTMGEDFIVWVYPDKIVATEEYAGLVRKLIQRV